MNIRIIVLMALAAAPLQGQTSGEVPVTLQEAVAAALDGNRGLAAAEARAEAAELGARAGDGTGGVCAARRPPAAALVPGGLRVER